MRSLGCPTDSNHCLQLRLLRVWAEPVAATPHCMGPSNSQVTLEDLCSDLTALRMVSYRSW